MRTKKILTPEEIQAKREKKNRQHKEWRDAHPQEWQKIVERHLLKKAAKLNRVDE
ncbi:hypothetical protein REC12_11330 [Desulfosporosinus sp. PR]|uniref:hypothetical protein n=1 Tax=Candidatus Desulfosporosinus nitrosoreducens TaxID=3401928 RepID=UPI0027F559D9|nr:hypothetical protein [Desulfosporosinus sp. PR]MDQ7094181.1 hypothetical protein [Desulfosporosinus sp. PR]